MTYAELKRQILNLGFETPGTYAEEPTIMVDAINRAMREITNLFPLIDSYKIAQNPLANKLPNASGCMDIRHYNGADPLVYGATGAESLYFECSGTGALTIVDGDGTRVITMDGDRQYQEYRAFLSGNATLTFGGAYAYDIKNIAVYGERYSGNLSDIPAYRKYIRYDFKELTKVSGVPMFIDFLDKVQEGDGEGSYLTIKEFQIEQRHVLVLDGRTSCEYTIFYRKNFTPVTTATLDTFEIQLDYDKEHLLPLLAAWYVWADDEPNKAAKWRNDYEYFTAGLVAAAKPESPQEAFLNELGW